MASSKPGRNIAVAVDASQGSADALKYALENVCTPNDTVLLFHARRPIYRDYAVDAATGSYGVADHFAAVEKEIKAKTDEVLEKYIAKCAEAKVKAEAHVAEGDPREELVKFAEELNLTLLVMGSRGLGSTRRAVRSTSPGDSRFKHGGVADVLLGSVSDYVAHHCPVPVLVVRGKPFGP